METAPLDLGTQRELAGALLAEGLKREEDRPKLLKSFTKHAKSRHELLKPGHKARSPDMQPAYDNVFRSDTNFLAALDALGEAERALVARFAEWKVAASEANANIGLPTEGAETEALQEARDRVAVFLELADLLYTYAIGAVYVVEYELLLGAHDANAAYLGKKAWITHQLKGAGRALSESTIETGFTEWAIPAAVAAVGVAVPPILAVNAVLVAAKIVVDLSKRQTTAARERLAVTEDETAKMYVLRRFNEQATDDTELFTQKLVDADNVLVALLDGLDDAKRKVVELRFDIPGLILALEFNDAMRVLLGKMRRPTSSPDEGTSGPPPT